MFKVVTIEGRLPDTNRYVNYFKTIKERDAFIKEVGEDHPNTDIRLNDHGDTKVKTWFAKDTNDIIEALVIYNDYDDYDGYIDD